jgi:hypothetical protein
LLSLIAPAVIPATMNFEFSCYFLQQRKGRNVPFSKAR